MIKNILYKYSLILIGILIGALGGYLYYYFVGCSNGSCAITSNPTIVTLYGATMGGLLFGSFKTEKQKNNTEK